MKFHDTFWRHAKSLDTFRKRFEILALSWVDTGLLIKLQAIKHDRVGKKKIPVKTLETAKPSHSEQGRNWQKQGRESWWVGWICLIGKVTLEVSWFDLSSLIEARWLKQFLKIAFIWLQWFRIMLNTSHISHAWCLAK